MREREASTERTSASIAAKGIENILKLRIAHVRMDLGFITYARRCQAKRLHRPVEIFTPVFAAERKAFTDGGLVDLDDLDSRFFQVLDLVADGQCDLPASERSRLIIADKR
jgi:hypothetical protein